MYVIHPFSHYSTLESVYTPFVDNIIEKFANVMQSFHSIDDREEQAEVVATCGYPQISVR